MANDARTMRERMLAGELYIADDPVLAHESQRAMALSEAINRSSASDPEARRRLSTAVGSPARVVRPLTAQ
jgi:maltose O-acetyltransferase